MATSFVEVLLQLHDEFGADILAGGKIQTYEAGTTTPLATYTDLAGSSANANPVILDASGMAVIRQTDGVAYKWVVYDADDNLLWTRDNITVGLSADAAASEYTVHHTFKGTPGALDWMGAHVFDDGVTFPIDFEGARGYVETVPGASYEISIRKNAVEVGTATIDTSGTYTFATTGGTTVSFSAGDVMDFVSPDSGSATNFAMTIPGSVD